MEIRCRGEVYEPAKRESMEINESQKKAITHYKGPAMVLAGPGSGKTFVITRRLKNLIINKKVNPENILVITFTRAAANEMKERFVKLLSDEKIRLDQLPTFGTFHSVFFGILKDSFGYNTDSLITEDEERQYLISLLEKDKDIEVTIENANLILSDIKAYKVSKEKGEKFSPKYLSANKFDEIFDKYRNLLFNKKKLDFHDMIDNCRDMLINHKDVLEHYREKYEFVLIDEFQDINQEQYDIIKLICSSKNLFVVGDDDQSIYKFRGSRPKVMFDFQDDYKKAKIIVLDKNYRCAKNIVAFSKKIINNNKERFKKSLKSDRKEKGVIYINVYEDSNEENDYIVTTIREILSNNNENKSIAILYRTNILSISLVSRLRKENIDFYMKDAKTNVFDQFAISDIISYLKIINGSTDIEDYNKIINKPTRYVSRTAIGYKKCSIDSLKKYYKDKVFILKNINKLENDIYLTKSINVALAIRYIRYDIGYEKYLQEYCDKKGIDYIEIKELLDELEEECVRFNSINQFLQYIDDYKKALSNDKNEKNESCPVKLMTFHSSKGLEFDNVIIIDANDGLIPHKKSIKQKDIETERRLFYVALTRAKDNLYILFTKKRNGKSYKPSRFVLEGIKEAKNGR